MGGEDSARGLGIVPGTVSTPGGTENDILERESFNDNANANPSSLGGIM